MDGKQHSLIGLVLSLSYVTGIATSREMSFLTILTILTFSSIFALAFSTFPDVDQKFHLWYGHRNPIFHSALIPGILSVLIYVPGYLCRVDVIASGRESIAFFYNLGICLATFWDIAHGSHLIADLAGKQPTGMQHLPGKVFMLVNGIGLIVAGAAIGKHLFT